VTSVRRCGRRRSRERQLLRRGLGFNYCISDEVFEYILDAIHLLADHGWKLLPLYRFDPCSGLWHHHEHRRAVPTLADVQLAGTTSEPDSALAHHLEQARQIMRPLRRRRRICRYLTR